MKNSWILCLAILIAWNNAHRHHPRNSFESIGLSDISNLFQMMKDFTPVEHSEIKIETVELPVVQVESNVGGKSGLNFDLNC